MKVHQDTIDLTNLVRIVSNNILENEFKSNSIL